MKIAVVVPTVPGREYSLERCLAAYEQQTDPELDLELLVVEDRPTCGLAWAAGAAAASDDFDFIHFTADDLQPKPGWAAAAISVASYGAIPIAKVESDTGSPLYCDAPISDGTFAHPPNVLVPFLTRKQWELGDWVLPIHYGTDDWVTYLAYRRGIPMLEAPNYAFIHHVAPEGRHDAALRGPDVSQLCAAMQRNGYLPPEYAAISGRLNA